MGKIRQCCPEEGRRRRLQTCRRTLRRGGRETDHHHGQPPSIQDPRLVLEQTKRHQRRQILPGYVQHVGKQTACGSRETEEDPRSPWSASLLGTPCPWSTYQNYWSSWTHSRCIEEEVKLIL